MYILWIADSDNSVVKNYRKNHGKGIPVGEKGLPSMKTSILKEWKGLFWGYLVAGLLFIIIRGNHGKISIFLVFSYELRCQCMMMIISSFVKTFYYLANFAVSNWFENRMI